MAHDHTPQKLRALPIQLIETEHGVILKRGYTELKISGEGAAEAVRLMLDMTAGEGATREEICARFASPDHSAVDHLIDKLLARRLLVPGDGVEPPATGRESHVDIFYWHFKASAAQVAERLKSRRIVILGVNCVSRQLASSLNAAGLDHFQVIDFPLLRNLRLFDDAANLKPEQWSASAKPPLSYEKWKDRIDAQALDCLVATSDFGSQQVMREWNRFCIEHNTHFLPVVLQNMVGYVGPIVIPGETACFECLRARQNAHMEDPKTQRAAEEAAFVGQVVAGFHPSMASVLAEFAAFELTKFYSGVPPVWNGGMLIEIDLLATRVTARKVLKIPRCAVCSPLNTRSSAAATKTASTPASRMGL